MKGVKTKKDKKKEKKNESLYGPASFDFGDDADDDDSYGAKSFDKQQDSNKQEKVTIQSLFEFKPWEVAVLVVELLLVVYLVLVVLRIIPIF